MRNVKSVTATLDPTDDGVSTPPRDVLKSRTCRSPRRPRTAISSSPARPRGRGPRSATNLGLGPSCRSSPGCRRGSRAARRRRYPSGQHQALIARRPTQREHVQRSRPERVRSPTRRAAAPRKTKSPECDPEQHTVRDEQCDAEPDPMKNVKDRNRATKRSGMSRIPSSKPKPRPKMTEQSKLDGARGRAASRPAAPHRPHDGEDHAHERQRQSARAARLRRQRGSDGATTAQSKPRRAPCTQQCVADPRGQRAAAPGDRGSRARASWTTSRTA